MVRLHSDQLVALDQWAASQVDAPSRPESIRRLVEIGLAHRPLPVGKAHKGAGKAKEMAKSVLNERLKDLPEDERITRKSRLLKGPTG